MTSPAHTPHPTNPTSTNDVAMVVRLPRDLREALKERAAAEDRSVASVMRLAARQYVGSEVTS